MKKIAFPLVVAVVNRIAIHRFNSELLATLIVFMMIMGALGLFVRLIAGLGGERYMDKRGFQMGTILFEIGTTSFLILMGDFLFS